MSFDDNPDKYFDNDLNTWRCSICNFVLRSDGECSTRDCAAEAEFKRLGIPRG